MKAPPIKDLKGLKAVKQQLEAQARLAAEHEAARKVAAAKARAEKDFFVLAVGPIKPLAAKHLPGHKSHRLNLPTAQAAPIAVSTSLTRWP